MSGKYQSLYVNLSNKKQMRPSSSNRFVSKVLGTIIIVALLAGALGKVYLDRQTKKMIQEWQAKYERLTMVKKETENLKMEQERYMSGNYILQMAETLDLRPSEPGQVRIMDKPLVDKHATKRINSDSLIALR